MQIRITDDYEDGYSATIVIEITGPEPDPTDLEKERERTNWTKRMLATPSKYVAVPWMTTGSCRCASSMLRFRTCTTLVSASGSGAANKPVADSIHPAAMTAAERGMRLLSGRKLFI